MSNNYLEFSEVVDQLTEEEAKWLDDLCTIVSCEDVFHKDHFDENGIPTSEVAKLARILFGDEQVFIESQVVESENPDGARTKAVWFYSEEANEPGHVGRVVQAFFRHFHPGGNHIFTLTWSDRADKLRHGEFSGGVMLVTNEKIIIESASRRRDELIREEMRK